MTLKKLFNTLMICFAFGVITMLFQTELFFAPYVMIIGGISGLTVILLNYKYKKVLNNPDTQLIYFIFSVPQILIAINTLFIQ